MITANIINTFFETDYFYVERNDIDFIYKADYLPMHNIKGNFVIIWVNNYILFSIATCDYIISDTPGA